MTFTFTELGRILLDMMTYETIIILSWASFLLVWGLMAFSVKRDVRGGGFMARLGQTWLLRVAVVAVIVVAAVRLGTGTPRRSGQAFFSHASMFAPPLLLGW